MENTIEDSVLDYCKDIIGEPCLSIKTTPEKELISKSPKKLSGLMIRKKKSQLPLSPATLNNITNLDLLQDNIIRSISESQSEPILGMSSLKLQPKKSILKILPNNISSVEVCSQTFSSPTFLKPVESSSSLKVKNSPRARKSANVPLTDTNTRTTDTLLAEEKSTIIMETPIVCKVHRRQEYKTPILIDDDVDIVISEPMDKIDVDDKDHKFEKEICSTLKVSNLGLGNSFFDNLDAKTLDNLVLAASQQKLSMHQSSGAKFSDLSRHSGRHLRAGSAFLQNNDNFKFRARKSILTSRNITQKARKSLASVPCKSKENLDQMKRSGLTRTRFHRQNDKQQKKNTIVSLKRNLVINKTPLPLSNLDLNIIEEDGDVGASSSKCEYVNLSFSNRLPINCLCEETLILDFNLPIFKQCQAIDYLDEKTIGCTGEVLDSTMYRVNVTNPFLALCELHQKKIKAHQCCPICGLFLHPRLFH